MFASERPLRILRNTFSCREAMLYASSMKRMGIPYAPNGVIRSLANSAAYRRAALTESAETEG